MREKWDIVRDMAVKGTLVPKERKPMPSRDRPNPSSPGAVATNTYRALHESVEAFHKAVIAAQKEGWDVIVRLKTKSGGTGNPTGTAIYVDVSRKLGPEEAAGEE